MSGEVQRRLRVNPLLCTGFGYCAEIVPELISLDDWGYPIVDTSPIEDDTLMQHAKRAIAACPRLALVVEETKPEVSRRRAASIPVRARAAAR